MKTRIFKSFFAMLAIAASFAMTACDEDSTGDDVGMDLAVDLSIAELSFTQSEAVQTVDVTSNGNWTIDVPTSADWVTVTPAAGKGNQTISVAVAENNTGMSRETNVRVIAVHPTYGDWDVELLKVTQSASDEEIKPLENIFSDNFDKKEAVKDTYWPYFCDNGTSEYANPQGSGAATVSYESNNVTARANSTSDSNYSDYEGSGMNNLFFGAKINYVTIKDITLPADNDCFVLAFGSEKYSQEGDSTFNYDEFHVYVSSDNTLWSEVEYSFDEGDDLAGRWNDAFATFRLTETPSTLSIMFTADVASVYRLDDVVLASGGEGAQVIDLSQGVENPTEPDTPDTPDTPVEGSFFSDNFDKKEAVKEGNYWPYFSENGTSEYGNPVGDGAATVSYDSKNVTARANYMSNSSYSAYDGSGLNNLFFGAAGNYVEIRDITLPAGEDTFIMTFGAEKYTQSGDSVFNYGEFHVYLSADNSAWTEITYAFADGDNLEGTWNDASATFRLTEVPSTLSVKFTADVASVYRLDDLTLGLAESASQEVTLGQGTTPEEPAGDEVTVTEAIGLAQGTAVKVKESTVVAVSSRSYLLTDGTSYILAYAGADPGLAVGDKVTVSASIGAYRSVPQLADPVATKVGHDDAFTHPEPQVMDGAAADAFLTSTYIKYVKMTGKLVKSGNYWNVELEGASTAQGSVSYPTAAMCPDELDGTMVDIYGYTIYQTRDTDVNIIATHVVPTGEAPVEPEPEDPDQPEEPSDAIVATVAEFLAAAEDETTMYRLSGTITKVEQTTYGNFYLMDDTGTAYIYGLCSPEGAQQYWAASGAKVGDDIVIETIRTSYNGSPQGKNAIFVSLQSPGTRAFWNPSSSAVTLGAAGQSLEVEMNGYNLTGEVTATSDNAAISASYANGVVTISAGANETDAVINATVTVAHGSLTHEIAVTQLKASSGGGEVVTVEDVMADQGWSNAQGVSKLVMDDNITVTFEKGNASTAPAYYNSGNAVRLYQNGAIMNVTASNGKTIVAIELTFANSQYYIAADSGTFTEEAAVRTWTGEAGSVKFTTTGTDKNHRAYVAKIKVTYQ